MPFSPEATMQADPRLGLYEGRTLAPSDLRPDLIELFLSGPSAGLPGSVSTETGLQPEHFRFLEKAGLCETILAKTPVVRPEALLLFGSEDALARVFPALTTLAVSRERDGLAAAKIMLPRNVLEAHASLREFWGDRLAPRRLPYREDHASLRDRVLSRWVADMVTCRNYAAATIARLALEPDLISLEYESEFPATENPLISRFFREYGLRAHDWTDTPLALPPSDGAPEAAERRYFGMTPVRRCGRFFKILAAYPPEYPVEGLIDHASFKAEALLTVSPRRGLPVVEPAAKAGPRRSQATGGAAPAGQSRRVEEAAAHPEAFLHPRQNVSSDRTARILEFCRTPRHREEIQQHVGMNNRDHFRKDVLNRLIAQGLVVPTLPDKPNSPKQRYVAVIAPETGVPAPNRPVARPD